jgi:hypothetical protein
MDDDAHRPFQIEGIPFFTGIYFLATQNNDGQRADKRAPCGKASYRTHCFPAGKAVYRLIGQACLKVRTIFAASINPDSYPLTVSAGHFFRILGKTS